MNRPMRVKVSRWIVYYLLHRTDKLAQAALFMLAVMFSCVLAYRAVFTPDDSLTEGLRLATVLCIVLFIGIRSKHPSPQVCAMTVAGVCLVGPTFIPGDGAGAGSETRSENAKLAEVNRFDTLTALASHELYGDILDNLNRGGQTWVDFQAGSANEDFLMSMKIFRVLGLATFDGDDYAKANTTEITGLIMKRSNAP